MFDSGIIDVAIGLIFVYLLLSLICSAITEGISQIFALRSGNLKSGIQNLLNDAGGAGLANSFYAHPLVSGLYQQGRFDRFLKRGGKPSYIPSGIFSLALFDTLVQEKNPEDSRALTLDNLRTAVNGIEDVQLKRAFTLLLPDASGDLEAARKNVERWFDDAMERVSGWYRRKTQMVILAVAVVVTVTLDADSLVIARSLWTDAELRELLVAAAQQANEQAPTADVGAIRDQLSALRLPIGWSTAPCWFQGLSNCTLVGTLSDILGFAFTVIALSLGAPFWFDLLNRFVEFRGSGERIGTRPRGDGQGR